MTPFLLFPLASVIYLALVGLVFLPSGVILLLARLRQ